MKYKLLLIFLIIATSCGIRKVEKTIEKKDVKTEITSETKTNIESNTQINTVDTSSNETIEITPIDSTKEMVVDGKSYKNTRLKKQKSKTNISASINKKDVTNTAKNDDIKVSDKESKDDKTSDREESILSYWWILLVAVAIWFVYKNVKK